MAYGRRAWDVVRPVAPELTVCVVFYATAGFFGPAFLEDADSWAKLLGFAVYVGCGLLLARSLVLRLRSLKSL